MNKIYYSENQDLYSFFPNKTQYEGIHYNILERPVCKVCMVGLQLLIRIYAT